MKFFRVYKALFEIQRLRNRANMIAAILEAEKESPEPRKLYIEKLTRTLNTIEILISDFESLAEYETKST